MKKLLSAISLFSMFFLLNSGFSQTGKDTILLLNGKVIIANVIDTTKGVTSIRNPKDSLKKILIENERIFSISNNKGESVMYVLDSASGKEFSIEEMRYFIHGEQDAEKAFNAPGALWGNIVIGAAAGLTESFFCPIPPFAFIAFSGLPRVKIKKSTVSNIDYLNHETYKMGYKVVGRKKRKVSSLIGGGIGLGVGIGTAIILNSTGNSLSK